MTPKQREAALRLADKLDAADVDPHDEFCVDAAVAILRELLAEPVINQQMTTELAEPVQEPVGWLNEIDGEFEHSHKPWMDNPTEEWHPVYAAPQQPMRCPTDGGECGAGGYCRPEQRKPLTPSMQAEVECDCLVAWNASTYGHSAQDTVHPMFLSAFILGYWAAERAHGITGEQK